MIIHRKDELTTSRWSGGTTTELFIHPAGSSYAARDFDVRISTATTELETTTFTHLPGYKRILVVLDGTLKLHFAVEMPFDVELEALEQVLFSGDDPVTGFGQVRDLNVMTSAGYSASVEDHRLAAGETLELECGIAICVVFVLTGMVEAEGGRIGAGDVIRFDDEATMKLVGSEDTVLLTVRVWQIEQSL